MKPNLAITLIAAANLGISIIGGLEPGQKALNIAISLIVLTHFVSAIIVTLRKA